MTAPIARATEAGPITFRPGTPDDAVACHELLWASVTDLGARQGTPLEGTAAEWWGSSEPLHRFLAEHAAEWWVAGQADADELIGYARSVERSGLFELTEFFVRPDSQAGGVGRALLERAFPAGRGEVRVIIATQDPRALGRYYRADTVARFPILTLTGTPHQAEPMGGLIAQTIEADDADALALIAGIERTTIGYARTDAELRWLAEQREGYVYRRGPSTIGFGFVGKAGTGPIVAADPDAMPEILLHVEGRGSALGVDRLDLEVPAPNAVAVRHLLGRGFRIHPWVNLLMSNRPFGQFDRFVAFDPPIFL